MFLRETTTLPQKLLPLWLKTVLGLALGTACDNYHAKLQFFPLLFWHFGQFKYRKPLLTEYPLLFGGLLLVGSPKKGRKQYQYCK